MHEHAVRSALQAFNNNNNNTDNLSICTVVWRFFLKNPHIYRQQLYVPTDSTLGISVAKVIR